MSREPHEPDLTPEQEQEVRRLLADARHTAPIPEDVATRLDRVLGELARGEHPIPVPAPVVQLASHRRRRAASMLVAAAAVVAVGVGLGQVVGGGSDSGSGAASSADSAREVPMTAQKDAPSSESALAGSAAGDSVDSYALPRPVRVREQHFSADVRHARRLLRSTLRSTQDQSFDGTSASTAVGPCPRGDWGSGRLVPATYDGQQAVLVFRAVAGDTQVVDLFACGSDVALRSITLPAP
ncbi:hypothetical protein FB382_004013 [Nocardioides ginsengisegetis]|uniref:Uncharacterized protein n=1 Tax=Nocardioides ginsengisegetis TaxID=661491 RepID=A0A7W3J3K0_9ACTN|nr:hypothetical protein [Nocardioides ginsengisegetis]MBA8805668.1 hypothetical protein [Nocardioides ginsengisegetis]